MERRVCPFRETHHELEGSVDTRPPLFPHVSLLPSLNSDNDLTPVPTHLLEVRSGGSFR